MNYRNTVFLCCVLLCAKEVALADKEDKSEEAPEDQEVKPSSNETSAELGPPDSHEAMNNREMNPKMREKRSYEFLMGLINNNSKYELTKVDPSVITEKPKVSTENIAASELLLELIVRIAAHPDQWDKVHQLLQKLDDDLLASKHIVKSLKNSNMKVESKDTSNNIILNKKEDHLEQTIQQENKESKGDQSFLNSTLTTYNNNNVTELTSNTSPSLSTDLKWPTFDYEQETLTSEPSSKVYIVNNNIDDKNEVVSRKYPWSEQNTKTATKPSSYQKNFAYHRVTGKPFYLNKNPKAYIAVSVIAPKPVNSRSQEDLVLENQLRQLKPWTHQQNLKNMASLRSRWIIQTEENRTESPIPP